MIVCSVPRCLLASRSCSIAFFLLTAGSEKGKKRESTLLSWHQQVTYISQMVPYQVVQGWSVLSACAAVDGHGLSVGEACLATHQELC